MRSIGADFGMFLRDLSKKVYEKLVDNLAVVIAAALLAFFLYFTGADKIASVWNSFKDQEQNYVERKISGRVYDAVTDSTLTGVKVGIVGDTVFVRTDDDGLFRLGFQAHKDSICIEMSLTLDEYQVNQTLRDIPLTPEKAEEIQVFTLTPSSFEDPPVSTK